ncbi:hypothetical protein [Spirosoma sp. KNUC1025]|uniref:hypothetical protein n=1 Tax=Spirosoma sp. KNUC1025 TaxID=2894082 RepID=UPI003869C753|nr:hypothetical protein LN737_23195 [Spirosoma sp. KNUC1025]
MMEKIVYTAFLLLLFSCKPDSATVLPVQVEGFDGKVALVAPSGVLKIKLNQPVNWRATGGAIIQGQNDTLTYTAPATAGIQQVVLKHPTNPQDSLLFNIAVTPSATLFQSLRTGNYVLIFRHEAADVGSDQPASTTPDWWKSCDAKLARQLNPQGLTDAASTGKTLKLLEIPVGRIVSSEFCRAFTSAEKMATGLPVQQAKELTLTVYDEPNRCSNTLNLAASQLRDGKNTIFITHVALAINQPDCLLLNKLQWGDAALFSLNENKTLTYTGTIPVKDWTELAK